jgi:hypothetical protein
MEDLIAEARKRGFITPEIDVKLADWATSAKEAILPSGSPDGALPGSVETRSISPTPAEPFAAAKNLRASVDSVTENFKAMTKSHLEALGAPQLNQYTTVDESLKPVATAKEQLIPGPSPPTEPVDQISELWGKFGWGGLTVGEKAVLNGLVAQYGDVPFTRGQAREFIRVTFPNEYAKKTLDELSRRAALMPDYPIFGKHSSGSKYRMGPHPETRQALGLEPLSKEDAIKKYMETRREAEFTIRSTPEDRYPTEGYYDLGQTPTGVGKVAREVGYKGRLQDILNEMKDQGILQKSDRAGQPFQGGTIVDQNVRPNWRYERSWVPEIQQFFLGDAKIFRKKQLVDRAIKLLQETPQAPVGYPIVEISPTALWNRAIESTSVGIHGQNSPLRQAPWSIMNRVDRIIKDELMQNGPIANFERYMERGRQRLDIQRIQDAEHQLQFRRDLEEAFVRRQEAGAGTTFSYARDAVNRNDLLGFDTRREAMDAILRHPDWETRWPDLPPEDIDAINAWKRQIKGVPTKELYGSKPYAETPFSDVLKRIIDTADEAGNVNYIKLKKAMPSEFARYQTELGDVFKNQQIATVSQLREAQQALGNTKYKYDFITNTNENLGGFRRFFPNEPTHFMQIWGDPERMAGFTGHEYPASAKNKEIPSIGWIIINDLKDTWVISEVQSDMLARSYANLKRMKEMRANESISIRGIPDIDQQIESLTKKIKSIEDWADYGLSSVLKEARANGVRSVVIGNDKAIQDLWSGHLGESKASRYYRDLPKRFGFKLDHVTMETKSPHAPNATFAHRVPVFIATTLGAKEVYDETRP